MIWQAVKAIAESMLPSQAPVREDTQKPSEDEKFFQDIDELARHLLAEAIEAGGHDRVAEQATSMAAALVGPPVGRAGANAGDEPRGGAAATAGDASGDGRS